MKNVAILVLLLFALAAVTACTNQPAQTQPVVSSPIVASPVKVEPVSGSFLFNLQNESSQVLLEDVMISHGLSSRQYFSPGYPAHTVNTGETILVITGRVQNKHPSNKHIAMWATGYDATGKQVSWTLDIAHIAGQIGLSLGQGEPGIFILHMNMAENLKTIRIFANNYATTPP